MLKGYKIMGISLISIILSWGSAGATATTHIWAPSTDVQPYKKWHITADYYVPTENDSTGARPSSVTNTGLTVGVLPFKNLNAEVGFDHKSGTGVDDYPVYFNTKAGIPENAYGPFFPAIAAGIYDAGTKNDKPDFNVVYFKAGKTLEINKFSLGRFSLGFFQGNKELLTYGDKISNKGILACWERPLPEISDKLWVAV